VLAKQTKLLINEQFSR